jgi:hypothetical protein
MAAFARKQLSGNRDANTTAGSLRQALASRKYRERASQFAVRRSVVIDLRETAYSGPEAAVSTFSDGRTVVWQ